MEFEDILIVTLVISVIVTVVVLLFGSVVKKAGFSRWWSLLLCIPIINIISIWVFAFVKWPAEFSASSK